MGELYKEQIVKKEPDGRTRLMKAGVAAGAIAVLLLSLRIPMAGAYMPVVALVLLFGVNYIFTYFKVEYEYTYTNGTLDIDVIYNKSRRRNIFSGEVRDFEIMARASDSERFSGIGKVLDCTSGTQKPDTYAFIAVCEGVRTKIVIEPNEMMLQAFSTALTPRKLVR